MGGKGAELQWDRLASTKKDRIFPHPHPTYPHPHPTISTSVSDEKGSSAHHTAPQPAITDKCCTSPNFLYPLSQPLVFTPSPFPAPHPPPHTLHPPPYRYLPTLLSHLCKTVCRVNKTSFFFFFLFSFLKKGMGGEGRKGEVTNRFELSHDRFFPLSSPGPRHTDTTYHTHTHTHTGGGYLRCRTSSHWL